MNKIIFFILILSLSSAFAENQNPKFSEITKNKDVSMYVDTNFWYDVNKEKYSSILQVFNEPKQISGKSYSTIEIVFKFKCFPEYKIRIISAYYHAQKPVGNELKILDDPVETNIPTSPKWEDAKDKRTILYSAINKTCKEHLVREIKKRQDS